MKFNKLKTILVLTLTLGILSALVFYRLQSRAYIGELKVSYSQDNHLVLGGQNLTYTLEIENKYENPINNVIAGVSVDPNADYVPGSSFYTVGGNTYNIPDDWISDRFNMGTLAPFQKNSIVYQVKIKPAAATNTIVSSIGQGEADDIPAVGFAIHATVVGTTAPTAFSGGDVFQGVNNTAGGNWGDPVNAQPGQVVEMKFRIVNSGQYDATNIKVYIPIPQDSANPSQSLVSTARAGADNVADSLTDILTVYLPAGEVGYLYPYAGHFNIVGVTLGPDGYNCPDGCSLNNQFLYQPLAIGNLAPNSMAEILFKVSVFNIPPTPTPTPTITPTPTPTGTLTPTPTPTPTSTPGPTATSTPGPTATPTPAPAGVTPAAVPPAQPSTGFGAVWFGVVAVLGIAIRLLLRL